MDQDIHQMVSKNMISVEIVVQGKAEIRHRTIGGRILESCVFNAFQSEFCQADMGVVPDIIKIIENKRTFKGVGVDQERENDQ